MTNEEINEQILELRERSRQLDQIIENANVIRDLIEHPGWKLTQGVIQRLFQGYKAEIYLAAKDENKSVRNYLGRMEGIEEFNNEMQEVFFSDEKRAIEERALIKDQLDSLASILDRGESDGYNGGIGNI